MDAESLPADALRLIETSRPCSYISGETAALEYRLFKALSPSHVEFLLSRGWRRFGTHLFRPACGNCSKCVPIRVDVGSYRPSKSQRKVWKKNQHIRVSLHQPTVTKSHLDLYNRWHLDMTDRRGWNLQQTSPEEYVEGFLLGDFPSLHEIRYFDANKLVGVGLVDILPNSISSAYFYHDPDWRNLSPGTFSLMCEIDFAHQLKLKKLYLGYWIEECLSMSYKNRFAPSEVLLAFPDDKTNPVWRDYSV